MIEVGDRVRVIGDVWDDHREDYWTGWEGVVKSTTPRPGDPYTIFVFFPKSRGKWRCYDFKPEELEVIS